MRALLSILVATLFALTPLPTASAGVCVDNGSPLVCVGHIVLRSDCREGAITVQGALVRLPTGDVFLAGEVYWRICGDGFEFSGHSYEVLGQGWYDMQGSHFPRWCGISTSVAAQELDCGLGPAPLPTLP